MIRYVKGIKSLPTQPDLASDCNCMVIEPNLLLLELMFDFDIDYL